MDWSRWKRWHAGSTLGAGAADDYAARIAACRSVNLTNRLHIDLENTLTPSEFAAIFRLARTGATPRVTDRWLRKLTRGSWWLLRDPEPHVRHVIDAEQTLYRAADLPPAGRCLVLGFCGDLDRLMLPVALVLQALPARRWDLLKITRPRGRADLRPGQEVADLDRILRALGAAVDLRAYAAVTVLGTSAGGRVAALVAARLGLRRAVLVGSAMPDAWLPVLDDLRGPQPAGGHATAYLHCFGTENAIDARNARQMQALFGGTLRPFAGVKKHNALHQLLRQGWFTPNFAQLMWPDVPDAEEAAFK